MFWIQISFGYRHMYYTYKSECRMSPPPFTAPKINIFPAPEFNIVNDDNGDDGHDCDDGEDGDDNVDDVVVVVGDCNSIQQCL